MYKLDHNVEGLEWYAKNKMLFEVEPCRHYLSIMFNNSQIHLNKEVTPKRSKVLGAFYRKCDIENILLLKVKFEDGQRC